MKARLEEILTRRRRLVHQAAVEREQISLCYKGLEKPVLLAGHFFNLFNSLRRSPLILTAAAALLWKTPWRRFSKVPLWLWRGWRLFKTLQIFR